MKKPVVDYKQFRLSRLNWPEYRHLWWLSGWLVYFILYFVTENLIPYERCHVIHCAADDLIPFCELFIIPYCIWYLLIIGSLLYFMLYNVDSFKRLSIFITVTQACGMLCYILYPSIQLLRPESFPRDNLLTRLIGFIYAFDTPTGVCPSLHVAYSLGIASVWTKEKGIHWAVKLAIWVQVIIIIFATFFVKQHSVMDAVAALPVCLLAELIVYGGYWKKKLSKS